MRILYLGDIVGEKTIPAIKKAIEEIKSEYKSSGCENAL